MSTSNAPSRISSRSSFLRLALGGEAGLLLLAWSLSRWLDVSLLGALRPTVGALLWGALAALPLLIGLVWMLRSEIGPIRRLLTLVLDQLGPLLAGCSAFELGALAAVAGVCEEILFRGVIQTGLSRWFPSVAAILATSVLFGLVHFASRAYGVFAGLMGLYLGFLFQLQGSLVAPIVTHGVYDFVSLLYVARLSRHARASPSSGTSEWVVRR